MAQFSTFFPVPDSGGITQNIGTNRGTGAYSVGALTNGTTAILTPAAQQTTMNLGVAVGDFASFTVAGVAYSGMVSAVNGTNGIVNVALPTPTTIAAATGIDVSFTDEAVTIVQGDLHVAGDTITGDLTGDVTGDVTGNADTATALLNARDFSVTGDVATANSVSFNGTGNVILNVALGDDVVDPEHLNANVAGLGLIQATGGELDVSVGSGATSRGLNISNDIVGINPGRGLEINTTSGALDIIGLNLNNTFVVRDTSAAAATDITEVTAAVALNTLTVGTIMPGDLVLAEAQMTGMFESFIYVGSANKDLSTDTVLATELVDITHSGDTVERLTTGDGLTGASDSTGSVTIQVVGADGITANADDIEVNLAANSGLTFTSGALHVNPLIAGAGTTYTSGVINVVSGTTGQLTANANDISIITATVADGGTGLATGDQIHDFVTGLTSGTLNSVVKFGAGGDLVDSNITDDGTTVAVGGTTLDINAAVDIDGATVDINTSSNGNITLGAAGTGEIRISGEGIATATDAETLSLVVGADGHVMTSAATPGFSVVRGADAATQPTVTSGDLLILPIITANRTIAFPVNPVAGSFFEVSNLSGVGAGSGRSRWFIGDGTSIVMGVTQPAAGFELDDATASFKFVYAGTPEGWVIIGAN